MKKNANYFDDKCSKSDTVPMGEYDSEERKRSKEEKVHLMTCLRDLMINEGAAVACAKRSDALGFRPVQVETNIGTSAEYLCKNAERGQ